MIYYINDMSNNTFLGTKEGLTVGTHNDFKHLSTNLWIREEVDNEDGFKLVHLESKKFLTATLSVAAPNGFLVLDYGMYHLLILKSSGMYNGFKQSSFKVGSK